MNIYYYSMTSLDLIFSLPMQAIQGIVLYGFNTVLLVSELVKLKYESYNLA